MHAVTIEVKEDNPLASLFSAEGIGIAGTMHEPLFCVRDVAQKIGDHQNYRRTTANYSSMFKVSAPFPDARGGTRQTSMFTEPGLYRYLLQSRRAEAGRFQLWVYTTLVNIRKQVVDEVLLAAKIERDTNAQLRQQIDRLRQQVEDSRLDALYAKSEINRYAQGYMELKHKCNNLPYWREPYHRWGDFYDYCIARTLKNVNFELDELDASALEKLESLAQRYFELADYEEGYRVFEECLNAEILRRDLASDYEEEDAEKPTWGDAAE